MDLRFNSSYQYWYIPVIDSNQTERKDIMPSVHEVKQIASELNDVWRELTAQYGDGEAESGEPLFAENLSNFMTAGHTITESSEFQAHFDDYVGKYIHRIGKTVFEDKDYKSDAPDIEVSGFEYGACLQKIRVGEIDFEENPEWKLEAGQSYPYFDFNPIEGEAKYFDMKTTFMAEWSWAGKQLKSAFSSLSDLMKLRNAIINKIMIKKRMCTDALKWRLVNAVNAENLAKGKVINLLEEYVNETGDTTVTAANALTNKEFLRHASMTMKKWRKFIEKPTKSLNPDGVLNWTPSQNLRVACLVDLEAAFENYLYADTFHDEFVKYSGYSTVSSWQGNNSDFDFDVRSSIYVQRVGSTQKMNFTGIVAIMWDKEGTMVYNEEPEETAAPYNPKGKFYNYYYSYDCSYFIDFGEPSITFIISDYTPYRGEEPDDWESATDKYYYSDTSSSASIGEMTAYDGETAWATAVARGVFTKIS